MSFGVTDKGFKPKRIEDISEETRQDWLDRFGGNFDLDFRTPAGQIKEILDERISKIWELAEAIYFSQYPRSAEGVALDNAVVLTGITRQEATFSTIDSGRAFGTLGTIIPAGTVISVEGNETAKFAVDNDATISLEAQNEIQSIFFNSIPDAGSFSISFNGIESALISFDASLLDIQTALDDAFGAGNITVTGEISPVGLVLTFGGIYTSQDVASVFITNNTLTTLSQQVVTTIEETQKGRPDQSELISLTALQSGPVVANAGSLNVIETAVVGLDSFTNLLDADLGRNRETDAELKIRQIQQVQIAGSSTLNAIKADVDAVDGVTGVSVFENNSAVTDEFGRPPHSVDVVVEGGLEQDIANALFDTVAAGIGYFGDITVSVTDTQGFAHDVKFSRPVEVPIYVEIDVNVDPAFFPAGGLTAIRDAVLAYGNALEVSDDVVVYGSRPSLSCSFQDVLGITDFVIRVGKTPSPITDDNVFIGPREISAFDSTRILVTQL